MAASELAVRELPVQIMRLIDDELPEEVVRTALATGKWKDAIAKQEWGAIANLLVMHKTYGLDLFAAPDQIYCIPFKGTYVSYPSAWGRLVLARRSPDFDGLTVEETWDDDTYWYVKVRAWAKGISHPVGEGVGYKSKKDERGHDYPAPLRQRSAKTHAIRLALSEGFPGSQPPISPAELETDFDEQMPGITPGASAAVARVEPEQTPGETPSPAPQPEPAPEPEPEPEAAANDTPVVGEEEPPFESPTDGEPRDTDHGLTVVEEPRPSVADTALNDATAIVQNAFPGTTELPPEQVQGPAASSPPSNVSPPDTFPQTGRPAPPPIDDGERRAKLVEQLFDSLETSVAKPAGRKAVLKMAAQRAGVQPAAINGAKELHELIQLLPTEEVALLTRNLAAKGA